jgi:hypothetical protein
VTRLRDDLEIGVWQARNQELLNLEQLDLGYRLIVVRQSYRKAPMTQSVIAFLAGHKLWSLSAKASLKRSEKTSSSDSIREEIKAAAKA